MIDPRSATRPPQFDPGSLTVFGTAACEDTAITLDRLRVLGIPIREVDVEADPAADRYLRSLHGGHRITPTIVPGPAAEFVAEPDLATVDRLAAGIDPGATSRRPTARRVFGDATSRAIPYADLPAVGVTADGGPGTRTVRAFRGRRFVALFLGHGADCLACLGYAKQLAGLAPRLAAATAIPVLVGRDRPDRLDAWRGRLPATTMLLADPDGAWTARVRAAIGGETPGSMEASRHDAVTLLLLDRFGAPRVASSGPDAGSLVTPDEAAEWLEFLEVECPECAPELPGWGD